jgi:HAMP domain-containing protein
MRSIQSIVFIRLFCVIIIFFAVVSGVACYLTTDAIRQFVISDSSTSLSFIVNNINANYKSDLTTLDQIATIEGFAPFDQTKARDVVKEFLELSSLFTTVHMYTADGTLVFAEKRTEQGVVSYTPKKDFHQKDPAFVSMVAEVIKEKQSKASETIFSSTGKLYQTYITPVYEDKQKQHVYGVLSGGVFPRWQKIDYLLEGLRLGQDNFILITDSRGHFITSDGITENDVNSSIQQHSTKAAGYFYPQTTTNTPPDGKATTDAKAKSAPQVFINERVAVGQSSFIVMSLPMPELKLVVTIGVNTHRIDQKTRELSYRLLVALVLGLLLSVFASVFVGDRLAKPFRQIAKTINEINVGNFAARVNYEEDDEIGHLSQRINTLAEKIQKSDYLGNLWSNEAELEQETGGKGSDK